MKPEDYAPEHREEVLIHEFPDDLLAFSIELGEAMKSTEWREKAILNFRGERFTHPDDFYKAYQLISPDTEASNDCS